jgi:hypothetical protein
MWLIYNMCAYGSGLTSFGWNNGRPYGFQGCFTIINLEFWYNVAVQDYLTLLLRTGSDMEQRWSDQGVMNMMQLLFSPYESVYTFENTLIIHSKPENLALLDSCIYKGAFLQWPASKYDILWSSSSSKHVAYIDTLEPHIPSPGLNPGYEKVELGVIVGTPRGEKIVTLRWKCIDMLSGMCGPLSSLIETSNQFCVLYEISTSFCDVLIEKVTEWFIRVMS